LQALEGIREKVQIATKFAFSLDAQGNFSIRGDPEHVRAACEGSLKRLGVDYIDLYYQHRVDQNVPIEVTVRAQFAMHRIQVSSGFGECWSG
jgi:aryl-alcohol dehydrogenase-like predicted oxidoreductase